MRDLEQPQKGNSYLFYEAELMKGNQTDEIEVNSDGIVTGPPLKGN